MNELTVREQIEAFEIQKRLSSADAPALLRRSRLTRMHLPSQTNALVFQHMNTLWCMDTTTREVSQFGAQNLVDYFTLPFPQKPADWPEASEWVPKKYTAEDHLLTYGALIFADRRTVNLVHRLAKEHGFGAEPGYSCHPRRQMDFISRMRGSVMFPVLTEVLNASYWLPAGFDPESLDDWKEALAIPPGHFEYSFQDLIGYAVQGDNCVDDLYRKSIEDAFRNEMSIFVTASRPSTRSDHALFQRIERYVEHIDFMDRFEPALLDFHSITGTTSALTEYTQTGKIVEGLISAPFMSKVGKKVIITDGNDYYRSEVSDLKFVDQNLTASFLVRGARRTSTLQDLLDKQPERLWVFEEPFSLPSGEPGTRWAKEPDFS
ncbi:hypothetical protein [Glutamicibacter ardleyensis]|uniref:hypothetical protein n=1 Tax=Glutamicibacter ardleyensis TaxID=225894 RepID=UPI003FD41D38